MIATLPAVQFSCKRARHIVCMDRKDARWDKRNANRRHRRALNRVTREFIRDPERFENEGFNAPSLSSWDIC
jgi:hypothetical protein